METPSTGGALLSSEAVTLIFPEILVCSLWMKSDSGINSNSTLTSICKSNSSDAPFRNLSESGSTSIVKTELPGGIYVFALEVIRNWPVAWSQVMIALGSKDPSHRSDISISSIVFPSPPISSTLPLTLIGLVSSLLTTSSDISSISTLISALEKTVVFVESER